MLLIGNGCFGELSIILRVTMVCVFFHSIYNNISTGINCPGVSCKYDTYRILLYSVTLRRVRATIVAVEER